MEAAIVRIAIKHTQLTEKPCSPMQRMKKLANKPHPNHTLQSITYAYCGGSILDDANNDAGDGHSDAQCQSGISPSL